jgi:hypothetical protein
MRPGMTEERKTQPERGADRAGEPDPANPTSEELDVEGPNESAPGREPAERAGEAGDERPPTTEG